MSEPLCQKLSKIISHGTPPSLPLNEREQQEFENERIREDSEHCLCIVAQKKGQEDCEGKTADEEPDPENKWTF